MGGKIQTRRNETNKKKHDSKVNGALRKMRRDKFFHDKIKFANWNKSLISSKL